MPFRVLLLLLIPIVFARCSSENSERPHRLKDVFVEILDSTLEGYEGVYYYENFLKIDSALKTFNDVTFDEKFSYYRYATGYYLHTAKDYVRAIQYSDSTFNFINRSGGPQQHLWETALVYYGLGEIYLNMGRYNESYAMFHKGKTFAEKTNRSCALSDYNFLLGFVLYKQENYELAAYYFKSSIDNLADCDNQFQFAYRHQEVLNNIGLSYLKAKDYNNASKYFFLALEYIALKEREGIIDNERADIARGVIYGNMGQLQTARNNIDSAKYYFNKSIYVNNRRNRDVKDAQLNMMHLAELHLQKRHTDSAALMLTEVEQSMFNVPNDNAVMPYHRLKAIYFQQTNNNDSAFYYLKRYAAEQQKDIEEKKELFSFNIANELRNIENNYAFKSLKQENQLKIIYLSVLGLIIAFLSAIILLIMRNHRRSKAHIKELEILNNEVIKQKQQLENTFQQLAQKNMEKDHVLRIVAHDLRNPISAIYSLSDILLKENNFEQEPANFIQLIQKSAFTSLELISELLDDSSIGFIVNRKNCNLQTILLHCVDILKLKASAKKQRIIYGETNADIMVHVNEEKIIRVICNLLSNAIKFTPEGKKITLSTTTSENFAVVEIADEGIGISDELLPHLFTRYSSAQRTGTAGEKSFGLGLSICKQIVDAHGGEITLTSVLNEGTTVTVKLPLAHRKHEPLAV